MLWMSINFLTDGQLQQAYAMINGLQTEEYKKKRPCAELCRYAADILEEKLIEKGLI